MEYDLIVIGSGPGGYVAAIRASQLGMKVCVIERYALGGVCLNWGCIPVKALLKSAKVFDYINHADNYGIHMDSKPVLDFPKVIQRSREVANGMSKGISYLFKKNKIDQIMGFGKILDNKTVQIDIKGGETKKITAKHIIIATGTSSKQLPNLKQDGKKIIGYMQAMTLQKLPESMIIVGSGAIGSEFAQFYNSMGTKVTIVEYMPTIIPTEDTEVGKYLARTMKKAGIKVLTSSKVENVEITNDKCKVTITTKKGQETHEAELVLSAVGITPNIKNIGIEENNIELINGEIKVDEYYRTNIDGIYAIGDITPGPALAHVASAEAIICVEKIAGQNPQPLDYNNIPACIYTVPEVASVGMTEKDALAKGYEVKIGKFPFIASGKASAAGAKDGFVKLVFDAKYGELLGAHLIGSTVTEMIAELVVARKLEITGHELIKTIHPHPTMSEAIMEAAAAAYNEVIHL